MKFFKPFLMFFLCSFLTACTFLPKQYHLDPKLSSSTATLQVDGTGTQIFNAYLYDLKKIKQAGADGKGEKVKSLGPVSSNNQGLSDKRIIDANKSYFVDLSHQGRFYVTLGCFHFFPQKDHDYLLKHFARKDTEGKKTFGFELLVKAGDKYILASEKEIPGGFECLFQGVYHR